MHEIPVSMFKKSLLASNCVIVVKIPRLYYLRDKQAVQYEKATEKCFLLETVTETHMWNWNQIVLNNSQCNLSFFKRSSGRQILIFLSQNTESVLIKGQQADKSWIKSFSREVEAEYNVETETLLCREYFVSLKCVLFLKITITHKWIVLILVANHWLSHNH